MAPLKLSEEQVAGFSSSVNQSDTDSQALDLHPEAYKVKGPAPEKMKTVSASLRQYANGLYGLL